MSATGYAREYARHGWIVTTDHLWDGPSDPLGCSAGQIGPHDVHPDIVARLLAGDGTVWRVWDDDGICYLTGRIILPDDATDTECLSPLRDYAVGIGAVRIRLRTAPGKHGVRELVV